MSIEPAPNAKLYAQLLNLLDEHYPGRSVGPPLEKIAALLGQIEQLYRDMPRDVDAGRPWCFARFAVWQPAHGRPNSSIPSPTRKWTWTRCARV
jgi:hypothetical protein